MEEERKGAKTFRLCGPSCDLNHKGWRVGGGFMLEELELVEMLVCSQSCGFLSQCLAPLFVTRLTQRPRKQKRDLFLSDSFAFLWC